VWIVLEDLQTHRESVFAPGFWALVVYRFGHWVDGMQLRPARSILRLVHFLLFKSIEVVTGITLPATTRIGRRLSIEHLGGIVVHGRSVIGDDCLIRQGVTLGNRYPDRLDDAPVLGNGVNVGAGAKILGSVRIGDGAFVGANAVVLEDIPAGASAVGVPARVIRRSREDG
jgi:serine O-acetyltransferase